MPLDPLIPTLQIFVIFYMDFGSCLVPFQLILYGDLSFSCSQKVKIGWGWSCDPKHVCQTCWTTLSDSSPSNFAL